MKDYEFLEPAQIELEEEVRYFNEQQVGLGYEFAREVGNTINRILDSLKPGPSFPKELADAEPKGFHTESFTKLEPTRSWLSPLCIFDENPSIGAIESR